KTSEKGRKEGAWSPPPGAKAARLGGPPRRFQAKRKLSIHPPKAHPGLPREIIDSSKLPSRSLEAGRTFRGLCRFGRGPRAAQARQSGPRQVHEEDRSKKEHDLGLALACDETHKILKAFYRGTHGDRPPCWSARTGPDRPHLAQNRGPRRADHSLKINRIAANRRELARA